MPATDTKVQVVEPEKKKRHRSPNFPTVGLREAIERTKRFIAADGKAGAVAAMAAKHIGFASAHGQAYSVLSALKKFGLLEDKDGRVVPTQRAMEIASLPDSDERRFKAIRQAAISPQIYSELIEQYRNTGLPHEETLAGELVAYKGFNPNSVKEFLDAFMETLEFAGLTDFSVLGSELKADGAEEKRFKIGDYVQMETNGILRFPKATKVTGFSEDGQFVFVEGQNGAAPLKDIILAEPPAGEIQQFPTPLPKLIEIGRGTVKPGVQMRQDVFSLPEGAAAINWPTPLSENSIKYLEAWIDLVKLKIKDSKSESPAKTES